MQPDLFHMSEFLTLTAMIGASFVFIYNEIKSLKREMKEDFQDVRTNRKNEIDNTKHEVMINISDVKQTFKNDLNTFRIDLTTHRKELKDELILMREYHTNEIIMLKEQTQKEVKGLAAEIILLSQKLARIEGFIASNQKPTTN